MKRLISVALLAATFIATIATSAHARWSDPQQIPWAKYNASNANGFPNRPDTTADRLEAAKVDTSVAFNLLDCDIPSLNQYGQVVTANDSVAFAYLAIYSDSSVAATCNFKAATAAFQVNWGSNSLGWQTVVTYTCTQTDAVKTWNIPLMNVLLSVADGENMGVGLAQLNWQFAPAVRVIFTGAATTTVPSAKIRLIKYKAPGSPGGATSNY